jgi:hypothetical protein
VSFYVSTATFFFLHCDEWGRVVALPRHKFVTGATLLQLDLDNMYFLLHADVNIHASNCQIWYRHPNSEAGNDEIQNIQRESKHGFLFCGNYIQTIDKFEQGCCYL